MFWKNGDADARARLDDAELRTYHLRTKRRGNLIGNSGGVVSSFDRRQQYRKFVTAQARDQVALAQMRADTARRLDQDVVAGLVPESVVHRLEVIAIDVQYRDFGTMTPAFK